jgi:hypothetical protein
VAQLVGGDLLEHRGDSRVARVSGRLLALVGLRLIAVAVAGRAVDLVGGLAVPFAGRATDAAQLESERGDESQVGGVEMSSGQHERASSQARRRSLDQPNLAPPEAGFVPEIGRTRRSPHERASL